MSATSRSLAGSVLVAAAALVAGCSDADPPRPRPAIMEPSEPRTATEKVSVRIELLPRTDAGVPRREVVPVGSEVEVVAPPGLAGRMLVRAPFGTAIGDGGSLRFRVDEPGELVVVVEATSKPLVVLEVLPPTTG